MINVVNAIIVGMHIHIVPNRNSKPAVLTALRPEAIRKLINDGLLQMGLFDERNLFEVTHPDFPNERLVACRNPELAERRRHKRRALLEALRGGHAQDTDQEA